MGDRAAHLDRAVDALADRVGSTLRAVSSYRETPPAGGPAGQGPYLNAVALVETDDDPRDLLHALQAIEQDAGRVRSERWGERTLDLDILLFGDQVGRSGELTVPHPRLVVRRFVLAPAAEIVPEMVDPLTGRSIADLLRNLDRRPSLVAVVGFSDEHRARLVERVADGLGGATILPSVPRQVPIRSEPRAVDVRRLEAQLDRVAADWDADRWASDPTSDRWLVADSWFGQPYRWAGGALGPSLWRKFRIRFEKRYAGLLRPTFLVARGSSDSIELGEGRSRRVFDVASLMQSMYDRHKIREVPSFSGVSILPLDRVPFDPDSAFLNSDADQVLAACAASRAG